MSRVTKGKLLSFLAKRGPVLWQKAGARPGHGTVQLGAKTKRERELIDRAIMYGRALEVDTLHAMINQNDEQLTKETASD